MCARAHRTRIQVFYLGYLGPAFWLLEADTMAERNQGHEPGHFILQWKWMLGLLTPVARQWGDLAQETRLPKLVQGRHGQTFA